jgi:hypothetical protein
MPALIPWEERWIPEPNTGCFLWLGARNNKGYGMLGRGDRWFTAHRYAWIMANGPIPAGQLVLHRCDQRACVRPDHLRLGTAQDNTDDMIAKGRRRVPLGEKASNARLRDCEVEEIRRLRAAGVRPKILTRMFKITNQHVSSIINGKSRARATQ